MSSRRRPPQQQHSSHAPAASAMGSSPLLDADASGGAPGGGSMLSLRQLVRGTLLFCYLTWFVCIGAGIGAYEGERCCPVACRSLAIAEREPRAGGALGVQAVTWRPT